MRVRLITIDADVGSGAGMTPVMEQLTRTTGRAWGGQSMFAPLKRVLARKPAPPATEEDFAEFAFSHAIEHAQTEREHDEFCRLLEQAGAEVVLAGPDEAGLLDAIFSYDSSLVTDAGAILLRPGKELRLPEVDLAERCYSKLGIPVIGRIESPGTLEGGDTLWLDEQTLAAGRGYRTNDEGIRQLRKVLEPHRIEVMTVDLPHWRGPGECLHLMSFISPVADRLAVVYLPLMSVPFVEELQRRGFSFIEVPDEEFETHGCNVLALAPKRVLVCNGNPVTRERLETAGCSVAVYDGDEISHNRAGGPTCLTRPILRA